MSFLSTWRIETLEHVFGINDAFLDTLNVGLLDIEGTELPGTNGYKRVDTTTGIWGNASGGIIRNSAGIIVFPEAAPNGWGTIRRFGIYDTFAVGTGELLLCDQLTGGDVDIPAGFRPRFDKNALTVVLDGMGHLSNFTEEKMLNHLFRKTPWDRPLELYVALCTASPGEGGTGANMSEVPETFNYERVLAPPGYWEVDVAQIVHNLQEILFNTVTGGDWGLVKYCAIVTSQTYGTGDMLLYIPVTPERNIVEGSVPRFAVDPYGIKAEFAP